MYNLKEREKGGRGVQGACGRLITETSNESLIGWSHSFWEEKQKVICWGLVGVWLHEFEGGGHLVGVLLQLANSKIGSSILEGASKEHFGVLKPSNFINWSL